MLIGKLLIVTMTFLLQGASIQLQGANTPTYTMASVVPYRPGLLEVQPVVNPTLVIPQPVQHTTANDLIRKQTVHREN